MIASNFILRDNVEIICYAYFTLEILLKIVATGFIFGKNAFLKDLWHCFFLIILLARLLKCFFFNEIPL